LEYPFNALNKAGMKVRFNQFIPDTPQSFKPAHSFPVFLHETSHLHGLATHNLSFGQLQESA
jgi:hypothetical protein